MDPQKIGQFICSLRKKNGMTQSELAQKLMVTSQAVSKWENGRGIPDIEMLKQISELFHVDLETLLNGEEKKKKKIDTKIFLFLGLGISVCIVLVFYFFFQSHQGFSFSDVVSSNESFSIKGVAAYSDEQSSIFISDIVYLDEENTHEEYVSIECLLYEADGKVKRKIGESGIIQSDKVQSLNVFLKQIEFHIDSFEISCKNLSESNLYLAIHALTKEDKTETYIVPLELTSCTIH